MPCLCSQFPVRKILGSKCQDRHESFALVPRSTRDLVLFWEPGALFLALKQKSSLTSGQFKRGTLKGTTSWKPASNRWKYHLQYFEVPKVDPTTTNMSLVSWLMRKLVQSAQTQPKSLHCVVNEWTHHYFSHLQLLREVIPLIWCLEILLYALLL